MLTGGAEPRCLLCLGSVPAGEIHETITDLKSLVEMLDAEKGAAHKATLLNEIQTISALLDPELREHSRAGEDYINDGEFFGN